MEADIKDIETNENENRVQVQAMASQIDQREEIIEKLEEEVDALRKKNRTMFKQQMKQPLNQKKQKGIYEYE